MKILKLSMALMTALAVGGIAFAAVKSINTADNARAVMNVSMASCITTGNPVGDCAGRVVVRKKTEYVIHDVLVDEAGNVLTVLVHDPKENDSLRAFWSSELTPRA